MKLITAAQMRAARALLRWSAERLAEEAQVGVATVRRAEAEDGSTTITMANAASIERKLTEAGVIFVAENGEGPGVRLRKNWAYEGLDAIAACLGVDVNQAADLIASRELTSFKTAPDGPPCVSRDAMLAFQSRKRAPGNGQ